MYLILEQSEDMIESMAPNMDELGITYDSDWKNWIFDLFEDEDLITYLYNDYYLVNDDTYHFDHWQEKRFWQESSV